MPQSIHEVFHRSFAARHRYWFTEMHCDVRPILIFLEVIDGNRLEDNCEVFIFRMCHGLQGHACDSRFEFLEIREVVAHTLWKNQNTIARNNCVRHSLKCFSICICTPFFFADPSLESLLVSLSFNHHVLCATNRNGFSQF